MNILIPDSWLREYLETKATTKQIKEYLSLCGPSVERIHTVNGEPVYDIEITTNRPDSMSIVGVAREAAAILPRFNIHANLLVDPYTTPTEQFVKLHAKEKKLKLSIITNSALNPRFTAMVFDGVTIKASPAWLTKALELVGIRSLNNVIDITNYIMHAFGQPVHAFDYDEILPKNGTPTMILRPSKKDETLRTLDGKLHHLPGDDIVIEDGSGRLIDLCGIMGAENSAIKPTTSRIILFMQTYDAAHIRRTSMKLAHRTEASALFEKDLDPELVLPSFVKGTQLVEELTGGKPGSMLYDLYPYPYKPAVVSAERTKVDIYLGARLPDEEMERILTSLGLSPTITKTTVSVNVPSFRRDITIDVDIIEELARLYGYHQIGTRLPETEPPMTILDPTLTWEEEVKVRLRDWGFTELYTYSMISEELMDAFGLDKTRAYKIANPLSSEWVYMRPSLLPSILTAIEQNLHVRQDLKLFELSMIYEYTEGNLPNEKPMLVVAYTGEQFRRAKGMAETLLSLCGIPLLQGTPQTDNHYFDSTKSLGLGAYGTVGLIHPQLLAKLKIKTPVTAILLDIQALVANANRHKTYVPIQKYPPVVEDLSFIFSKPTHIGDILTTIKRANPLVKTVELLDMFEQTRTFRITYEDPTRTLTADHVEPVRNHIVARVTETFGAKLRS